MDDEQETPTRPRSPIWSRPSMAEFRGSSPARPRIIDATGTLALRSNKPPKKYINFPSTIRADVPRSRVLDALRVIDPHLGGGRQNTASAIRGARQKIAGPPRRSPRTRGTENQPPPPVTSSAATRPVRRTAAEKARRGASDVKPTNTTSGAPEASIPFKKPPHIPQSQSSYASLRLAVAFTSAPGVARGVVLSPAITPPLERRDALSSAPLLPSLRLWSGGDGNSAHALRSCTLQSGKEFSLHGAIILDNFDVLDHVHKARARNEDIIEKALDDHPITVPVLQSRSLSPLRVAGSSLRTRSQSPPRRSTRLALPLDESIDGSGRTRAAHRARQQELLGTGLKGVVQRHVANAQPIHISTTTRDYTVASTGWAGIRDKAKPREHGLTELTDIFGMQIVEWDGKSSRPLVDQENRVIAVLGGRPNDAEYLRLTEQAADRLETARADPALRLDNHIGRRGPFPGISAGVSFGGGQQVPGNLSLSMAIQRITRELFLLQCFLRIAGFANGLFRTWNPSVHALYQGTLDALISRNSGLIRNFPRHVSAFAAATFNLGPATVTLAHTDALNLAWGWCAITALGVFDPRRGGHLVLWDLCLIIQFPPGSTILIPSAIL
ncbi:hypothetical protein B0H14DRAFT_3465980 [Mycena olivaceomarginata]|nr:hypothetical protein B0H14DRAFT_3465980 [Mycena olivaceomarginata]